MTFVYFPVAHMVWDANGCLFGLGALDFAGGTVVHINAGVAGLVGAIMVGKRIGFGKDMMAPHSMTHDLCRRCHAVGRLVRLQRRLQPRSFGRRDARNRQHLRRHCCGHRFLVRWLKSFTRGKASMLGAASGMVAGLVAITPAAGIVGPMGAIVMGLLVSPLCYFFVSVVKNKFGYDDTADVFGVHGIGGMFGALATGIFASSSLGGIGYAEGVTMGRQVYDSDRCRRRHHRLDAASARSSSTRSSI